jgi:hypothetical protein
MGRNDDKRNFALRETSGDETSLFSGTTPWQAALKAARQLTPIGDEQDAKRRELALRETGQRKSTFTKPGPGKKTLQLTGLSGCPR